mmetsp:Transcript_19106/g.43911  ORF Transcript_19106/g.43911 Transcript_19106/m.43911 type:complete len:203 (-) Transcript_19106:218-826(-)
MLGHPSVQWHIVILSPSTQGRQPQHRLLVPLLLQATCRILHQQSMTIVHRVTKLEHEHSVSTHLFELRLQFRRCQPKLVHAIVVHNTPQDLQLSTHKPVPSVVDQLDVRMLLVGDPESAPRALLLVVLEEFRRRQNRQVNPVVHQCDLTLLLQLTFRLRRQRQNDRNSHRHRLFSFENVLEVEGLQVLLLGHKPLQRSRPSL